MSIREAVASALIDGGRSPGAITYKRTDAAITAFLQAAATIPDKDKRTWHMRPDEATEEMKIENCELDCGYAACHKALGGPQCVNHGDRRKYSVENWEVMCAAAPKFELDP